MPRPCASDQLLLRMLSLAVPAGSVNTVLTEQRFIAGYGDKNIAEVQELYMDKVRKRRVGIERVVELCGRGNHSSTLRVPTLHDCAERDVYQFGVYSGASMKAIASFFRAHEVPFHQIVGFDSFMGLPAEHISAGSQAIYRFRLTKGDWRAGSLSAARYFARSSGSGGDVLAPLAVVLQQLTALVDEPRVRFVSGFFNESLTPQLARTMRPALYIDCDADLYSSTRESLEWMLAHKLVVPGTVLYYDDWQAGGRSGQERAHAEFMKKHKVIAKRLAVTDESVKKAVFEVLTVGQERHRRA